MDTVGSMFAGVGGLCLAFINAGFTTKWANELNPNACVTYRANFPMTNLIEQDVTKIKDPMAELGKVDVLTSGFPCQSYSVAGLQKGFEDPRGRLFFETVRFIKELQPKAFLLENVKNLTTHNDRQTIGRMRDEIHALGYSFIDFVLNASTHSNIPQNRERVFIVGFRGENGEERNRNQGILTQKTCTSEFQIPEVFDRESTFKDLLEKAEVLTKYYYGPDHKYWKMFCDEIVKEYTAYQYRRYYIRENKSALCPTLTANMGSGGNNVPIVKIGDKFRKLTPREAFRFQGFPETFVLPEKMADANLYKQAGNSVVVPLVERIATEIKRVLISKSHHLAKEAA